MVYLGPIQTRLASIKAPSQPLATTAIEAYAREQHPEQRSAGIDPTYPSPGLKDRRKKKDRRAKSDDTMLETREGKERRKSAYQRIDISI